MLAKKPPMGFNTWNTFGRQIDEKMIMETADKMVELGLLDAGYEYLVIDDCWSEKQRDPQSGKIVPDKKKFPNGMKYVSDYVHSKGLKFGMYSCCGTRTCDDYPGSFDHEFLDAKTFAEYGCDFLKYDYCFKPENAVGSVLYRKMAMALKMCGREILLSACNWGCDGVNTWARSAGAHMYRSTGDIFDNYNRMKEIALSQVENLPYSGPGCFNDIDMLTCGMYGFGNVADDAIDESERKQYDIDYKTEFALWCMYSSPLMIGCDIRKINDTTLKLLTNKDMIRINQDEEGRPAYVARGLEEECPTFIKLLSDNEVAVLFTNLTDMDDRDCRLYFDDTGLQVADGYGLHMKDVFTGEDLGVKKEIFNLRLNKHDCAMYLCKIEK